MSTLLACCQAKIKNTVITQWQATALFVNAFFTFSETSFRNQPLDYSQWKVKTEATKWSTKTRESHNLPHWPHTPTCLHSCLQTSGNRATGHIHRKTHSRKHKHGHTVFIYVYILSALNFFLYMIWTCAWWQFTELQRNRPWGWRCCSFVHILYNFTVRFLN